MPTTNDDFQRAFITFLGDRLTEPMTLSRLAELFQVSRDSMRRLLATLGGVERTGSLIRVPWRHMPVTYVLSIFVELGIVTPATIDEIWRNLGRERRAAA